MSGIPSDIAGSALQAGFQARNVAKVRDAERATQGGNTKNQIKGVDEAGSAIETSDNDTEVYADAEGTGSKGRAYEDELLGEETDEKDEEEGEGISTDADGQEHLDIQA